MSAKVTITLPMETADSGEVPELPALITISLAAEMLGMSRQAVHKMTRTKPVPRLKAWRLRSAGNDRPLVVREFDVLAMKKPESDVVSVPEVQE
jgi:hypothetical protein